VDFEIVEIDLKNKPEWYPRVNPASKVSRYRCKYSRRRGLKSIYPRQVPAIWFDAPKDAEPSNVPEGTFILPESSLIVEFLADVYPQIAGTFDQHPNHRPWAAELPLTCLLNPNSALPRQEPT